LLNRLFAAATSTGASSDHARVGKTPGATASVNLYALTTPASKQQKQQSSNKKQAPSGVVATKDLLGFVDLPGL
jgi:GTP-binding protein EngB required for normal cell division